MESGVITVGVLQPDLLGWYLNGASSHCSCIHWFLHKTLNPAAGAAAPDCEGGRMIPEGPERPDTIWFHYLLSAVMAAHPWNFHCAPKKPQSAFLHSSLYGLCIQVSPVQAQILCVPSSTTSGFVRGCPHLWKQREVFPDHTVCFFSFWNGI